MPRLFPPAALILGLFLFCLPRVYAAQHQHPGGSEPEPDQLGTVSFATSCSPSVQAGFERGVALLHSFGYNNAAKQFREVEQQDPSCAIAYWGEAMTLYHQLWDRPSQSNLEAGWQLVQKAQAASAKNDRERLYVEAAAAFYRDPDNRSYESRSAAYSQALANLRDRYPEDREATAFYALSLIASPHADDDDFAYRKKAVAILETLYAAEPNHPGVAHYLIHACDNPEMAKQGLPAARRYAQIAPASPHAVHMPSHIFARLGLWQDDIQSNLASKAAAEKQSQTPDRLHAMLFLEYAYLQTGQDDQAKAIETEALQVPKQGFEGDREGYFYYAQVYFPALLALETKTWKNVLAVQPPAGAGPEYQAMVYWAQAVAAGHLHDAALARTAVMKYDAAFDAVRKTSHAY
ncbi:MAG: hypothetical protein JO211_17370, partial [Acidobacteriaceae bacterium]|nr:hypothetical protein [Acidobacteriaceae bacterium]